MLGKTWNPIFIFTVILVIAAKISSGEQGNADAAPDNDVKTENESKAKNDGKDAKIMSGNSNADGDQVEVEVHLSSENVTNKQSEEVKSAEVNTDPDPKQEDVKEDPDKRDQPLKNKINNNNQISGLQLTPEQMQKFKIWKDGVIPYYIDTVSYSDKVFRDTIRNSLFKTNAATGLNFVELPTPPSKDEERWVFFVNRRGLLSCADHTVKDFTNNGVQQVVLGYDCVASKGELEEAVMSIAGVPAQHNAPNRDEYINVHMENIISNKSQLFEKVGSDEWPFQDLEYDFDSITHYDMHKYSANGHATIEIKDETKDMHPSKTFSPIDIKKIKMLYNYVTKNKQLRVPDCKKLYKPSGNIRNDQYSMTSLQTPFKNKLKKKRNEILAQSDYHSDK